jgi:glutathione synthase/RimK-type ligase-like ATP-grasp enzyme
MILVWGERDDSPIAAVLSALERRRARFSHVDRAALARLRYDLTIAGEIDGWLTLGGRRVGADRIGGVYLRPGPTDDPRVLAASAALLALVGVMPATVAVVNRPSAGRSNASKPYQLGLIADAGLDVPDTLVTTDVAAARAFLDRHERLIYKSTSGIRSIVAVLERRDAARLEGVAAGPVQLQAYVPGTDVRVHVVGDRWFACEIHSDAADYRYASASGTPAELRAREIPPGLGEQLVTLSRRLGLAIAGIDLRLTPDGRWVCFEVNPSPGFTWYEEATGHPIADAVADLLDSRPAGRARRRRAATAARSA